MKSASRTLKDLYRKYFEEKLFNKILFFYSLIIVIALVVLSFFIYQYFTQYMLEKEISKEKEVLESVNAYMDQSLDLSRIMVESLYASDSLMRDVTALLEMSYSEYLTYSFDHYFSNNTSGAVNTISNAFKDYLSGSYDIHSIVFSSGRQKLYQVSLSSLQMLAPLDGDETMSNEEDSFLAQSRLYPTPAGFAAGEPSFSFSAAVKDTETLKPIGEMSINFSAAGISRSVPLIHTLGGGYLLVMTRAGEVLYDSSGRMYGHNFPVAPLLGKSSSKMNREQYITSSSSNKAGVIVAWVAHNSVANASSKVLLRWMVLITFVCISGAVLLTYMIMLRFSKRTKVIVRAMEKLNVGQMSVRIPLERGDELYQIASNFNKMSERLNDYVEKVYISEIKQKNAEIVAMQMQINPHFLYNTLEAIRMNAVAQGVPEVGKMIFLLANLFRNSMKSGMVVMVAEEMERCKQYLELFQIRYPDQLEFSFDLEGDILDADILKLSVQPMIENYVLHGFRADRLDNRIMIEGRMQSGNVQIQIRDNGRGIPYEELLEIRQSFTIREEWDGKPQSIGLRNVNSRIQMYYGSEYGLEIESEAGAGTCIRITIPAGKE